MVPAALRAGAAETSPVAGLGRCGPMKYIGHGMRWTGRAVRGRRRLELFREVSW